MAERPSVSGVDVAAALIVHNRRVLLVYNDDWRQFTLPMTKVRTWKDKQGRIKTEDPAEAGARVVAECLGVTCVFSAPPVAVAGIDGKTGGIDLSEIQVSKRTGRSQRYNFQLFRILLQEEPSLVRGVIAQWATPEEVGDLNRRPISDTGRRLLERYRELAKKNGWSFP